MGKGLVLCLCVNYLLSGVCWLCVFFFAFDKVCALAGETINPRRDVPLSIAYTLAIVAVTYLLSALALSGMVPADGSPDGSSFVLAFAARGWGWACQASVYGEGKRGNGRR